MPIPAARRSTAFYLTASSMLAALACVCVAGAAHAAAHPFTAAIAIQVATLDPLLIPGIGTAIVNGSNGPGHLTSLQLPASPFAISGFVLPLTDPGVLPIRGLQVTAHNSAGSFAGSGGVGFGGAMPIDGAAKICLYGFCGTSTNISNLTVPLTVIGQGGAATVQAAVNLTVVGAPWTTGTAAVGTLTVMGGVAPLSNTNVVTLVTPIFISTNIGAFAAVPAFGFLTLTNLFVPEPGTLALLGSGVAVLVAYARRKDRR